MTSITYDAYSTTVRYLPSSYPALRNNAFLFFGFLRSNRTGSIYPHCFTVLATNPSPRTLTGKPENRTKRLGSFTRKLVIPFPSPIITSHHHPPQEQAQFEAIREQLKKDESTKPAGNSTSQGSEKDFEGGFGGQEDLEDRYATTSGEH